MEFSYLGPLEVRSEGAVLPLGGQKQRGILAVLLLHANRVVSVDRLVDDVWGGAPPRTVNAYIQNCVSRLRTVLGRDAIETHASGYALRVDPDDVDALRFAHAIESARALQTPERAAALGEALALWRGPPLAEFAYEPFAQPEISRLEELRLEAVAARLDAELELGRHAEALPELEALTTRHPANERFRYLAMLALYRAGRQRDALAAYQQARRELVERYGLEPGEELRALERMILAHDPALLDAPPQPDRSSAPAGVMLVVEPAVAGAAAIVERSGGVERANGERLVAAYGIPHAEDDDALRALGAARDLHAADPRVRVAIDRVAGTEPAAFDDRLVFGAGAGETVLGPGVLPLVAHAVDVVAQPGGGFRVLRADPAAEPVPRRLDTPFVGRAAELERLRAELDGAIADGVVHRLAVIGEAGIGKTRLAHEFVSRAPVRVASVRCRPRGETDPLAELAAQLAPTGQLPDRDKVAAALRGRTGAAGRHWALRRLLEVAARDAPVALVLDDLQWAQPDLLDLLDYLAGWLRAPVLVLGLARAELLESRPEIEAHTLFLDPLSPAETASLARALDAGGAVEAAEGNPLYLEQLAAWSGEGHAAGVPPTIESLIAMRVDRLPEDERRVLDRASAAGVEFWRSAVAAASPEEDVAPALMALVRRRLVHPAAAPVEGEDGFRFHHALIRDVVYGGLPEDERGRLHAAVARSLGPEPVHDALAGHHLEEAAATDPALAPEAGRRLGAAGLRALAQIDAVRARDLLGRAAPLVPAGPQRRELDWAFATATQFGGDADRADALLEAVAEQAAAAGDETNVHRARIEQVWPRLSRSAIGIDEALALLDRALPLFEAAGDDFALARAWDIIAVVNGIYLLRAERCEEAERRARACYERAGATTGASDVRLAGAAHFGPTPAAEAIRRCEALLAEAQAPVWASFVQPFLAGLYAMEGRFDEARAALDAARAGRAEFADPATLATSWTVLAAEVEARAGELDLAERLLADGCDRLRAAGDAEWLALATAALGGVHVAQGRYEEGLAAAGAAFGGAPAGHLTTLSIAGRVRALALAGLGRVDDAVAAARENVAALEQTDALVEQARAQAALAVALDAAGSSEAAACRAAALALSERKGDVVTARALAPAR